MTRSKWVPVALYALVALPVIAPHIFPWTQISKETYAFGDFVASLWSFWWTKEKFSKLWRTFSTMR